MTYWDGAAQGARVGSTIADNMYPDGTPLDIEAKQQQNGLRSVLLQNAGMQSQESARQLAVAAGMRQAAANAQPTPETTTTTVNGGYTPAPPDATAYSSARALLGAPADDTPAKTRANEARYGIVSPTTVPTETPAPVNYTETPPANPLADEITAKAQQDAQPTVTTTTTPGSPANPLKAQIQYLNSIGETQKAQDLTNSLMDHANKVMALTGNPNDALKIINDATGEKLAYSPLASLDAITSDGQLVGYIDKNKYKELTTAGAQPLEAMKGAMIPLDLGGGGKAVLDFLAKNPDATDSEVADAGAKAGVPLSKMIPLLAERQKVAAQKAADERQLRSQAAADARQDKSIAAADARQNKTIAAIAGRQNTVIPNAFDANGNPILVNRATGTVQVASNPTGVNVADARNNTVQGQAEARQRGGAQTANVSAAYQTYKQEAPELIALHDKVVAKGTLPSGGFKDINALNQWLTSKQSDPDTVLLQKKTKFLADSLMKTIGGSQGGEWAFKLASNILDPTLSGKAFAEVVNSHGEAMKRMVGARQSFGQGQATVAPAGTKVPKKGGGFYTSDGKGGWY